MVQVNLRTGWKLVAKPMEINNFGMGAGSSPDAKSMQWENVGEGWHCIFGTRTVQHNHKAGIAGAHTSVHF